MSKKEFDAFDEEEFLDEEENAEEAAEASDEDTDGEEENESEAAEDDGNDAEQEGEEQGTDFAAMAASDLAEINKAYPTLELKTLGGLKNIARFAELREKGVTAVEAFAATNAEMLMAGAERVGATKATGKAHLQSVAKKAGARAASRMTNAERDIAREALGDMSDSELDKLFARATKK